MPSERFVNPMADTGDEGDGEDAQAVDEVRGVDHLGGVDQPAHPPRAAARLVHALLDLFEHGGSVPRVEEAVEQRAL